MSGEGGARAVPFYGALLSVDGTEMSSRMNIITGVAGGKWLALRTVESP